MHNSSKQSGFCLLGIIILLNACSGLTSSDQPAVTTWWLLPYAAETRPDYPGTASAKAALPRTATAVALKVSVVPGLDTDQILTLSNAAELVPYAGATWADHAPELLGSLVHRTLQASGRFEVISGRTGDDPERCDLQLEFQDFFAQLGADAKTVAVQVAVNGRYQCGSATRLTLQLHALVPVHDHRMKFIVAAFQQALDDVMKELLGELP